MRYFKILLVCCTNLLLLNVAIAQTSLNYTKVWTAKKPIQSEADIISSMRTVQEVSRITGYIDGFGRPVQSIAKQASPTQNDVVDMHLYDLTGVEKQKYLPFVSSVQQSGDITNDGNYKLTAGAQQTAYNQLMYPSENNYFYSQIEYEPSPLNRIVKNFSPGKSWVGSLRFTSVQICVNTVNDNVRVWTTLNNTQGIIPSGANSYAPGTLYKKITTDEQGAQQIEFKDKNGHLVLKKAQLSASIDNGNGSDHTGWLCTYYVYDDFGNLRFVITPKAVGLIDGSWSISNAIASDLCIRYEYDLQGRVIIKKNPGAEEQRYVYDQRGRLVMSQDGNQRIQQKWQYFQYDALDRPISTGLISDPANYNNILYHQGYASISSSYPIISNYNVELLSQSFYDNYSWVNGNGLGTSLDISNNSNINIFYSPSNTTFPYPQAIIQTTMTRGLCTGAKTEILGSGGTQYLYSENFYDDKGRTIQIQNTNLTGQIDKVTTQYSWSGSQLRSYIQHSKGIPSPQDHNIITKLNYDAAYRLLNVTKNVTTTIGNSTAISSGDKLITSFNYDESGQLKNETFGNALETLNYDYNIRGWLTGINRNYTIAGNTSNFFGMELAYDNTATTVGTTTFQNALYNGNISGQIWKQRGDGIVRKYDFTFDKVNRLTSGSFLQNTTSTSWDKLYIDYSVNNIAYDNNGNITAMNQNGFDFGGNLNIDDLVYKYSNSNNSNQIQNVLDNANVSQSRLGDFHYSSSKSPSSIDYSYDDNGNQTKDDNKNISNITYNSLNLPALITISGKGTISYTYDAAGNKLRKIVQENAATVSYKGTNYNADITTTTTYIGQFVYQSKIFSNTNAALSADLSRNESLQFIGYEEGRIRFATPFGAPSYHAFDYYIRDHQGNIRTTLTDEQTSPDTYPAATLETSGLATEQTFYDIKNDNLHVIPTNSLPWYGNVTNSNYQNNNGLPSSADPTINSGNTSANLYKLNGVTGERYGLGITLKVMVGDVIDIYGKSLWHQNGSTNNADQPLAGVISSLINAFSGTAPVLGGSKGAVTGSILNSNPSTTGPLATWLSTSVPTPSGQTPKAYINWIFFDEQFKPVFNGSFYDLISLLSDNVKQHNIIGITVPKNGYIYIYCSNESNQDVFFDNLQVVHHKGPLLEEQNYYPQGLAMFAINGRAYGKLQTNFGYQGKEMQSGEFNDGTGLEEYDFAARYYDPQLGRWWIQDPKCQYVSPYLAMGNHWVRGKDPNGEVFGLDDLVVALVGGTINLVSQAASGNIHSIGQAFGYFGTGVAAGIGTYYLGPAVGGAILGLGNNLTQQISTGGPINAQSLIISTAVGGITGGVSAQITNAISPYVSTVVSRFTSSPVMQRAIIGAITGAITGGVVGGVTSAVMGRSFWQGFGQGATNGAASGTIYGGISGFQEAKENSVNPWTGKSNVVEDIQQTVKIDGQVVLTVSRNGIEQEMILTGEDISGSGTRNLDVANYSQKDVINFLTANRSDVQITPFSDGRGTTYTTPNWIIKSYTSFGNGTTMSIQSVNSNQTFVKLRFIF